MSFQDEQRRGAEARQVLENALYRESWEKIRDTIVSQLEQADLAPERRIRLNDLLVSHRKARQWLELVMQTGQLAGQEIERQSSLTQRGMDALRRVI